MAGIACHGRIRIAILAGLLLVSPSVLAETHDVTSVEYLAEAEYFGAMMKDIRNAKRSVTVVMYLLMAGDGTAAGRLIDELRKRAADGVSVEVILDDRLKDQKKRPMNAPALESLKARGIAARYDGTPRVTHVKLVVIDGRIVYVGSQNWTTSALFGSNYEFAARVESERLAHDLLSGLRTRIK